MNDSPPSDSVHELLPWFVSGTLEPREAAAFAVHLEECSICREELPFLETVQAQLSLHGDSFLDEHPEAKKLVRFVRGELDQPSASAVQSHVDLCATCATEARWIRGESVAEDEPSAAPQRRSRPWLYAVAAAFAALAISFWLWPDGGHPTRVLHPQAVRGLERSEGPRPQVRPRDGAPTIPLLFEIDLPASAFPVQVELVTADGSTAFRVTDIRREDLLEGYLLVDCARKDCRPGEYEFRLKPSGASDPSLVLGFEILEP